ncbi:10497_t:CDS:2, partial [Acaulospora colombiana]
AEALSGSTLFQNESTKKSNPPIRRTESVLEMRNLKDYRRSEKKKLGETGNVNNRPRPNVDQGIHTTMTVTDPESEARPHRSKSLVKPERARSQYRKNTLRRQDGSVVTEDPRKPQNPVGDEKRRPSERREPKKAKRWYQCECPSAWVMFSRCITCWAPSCLMSCCGLHDRLVQQAWREKIALVFIILIHCAAVGFLTFGLTQAFCGKPPARVSVGEVSSQQSVILGKVYDISNFRHQIFPGYVDSEIMDAPVNKAGGHDLSFLFQVVNQHCRGLFVSNSGVPQNYFPCVSIDDYSTPNPLANSNNTGCHLNEKSSIRQLRYIGDVYYDWEYLNKKDTSYVVYNGVITDVSLIVIVAVVLVRFFLAVLFRWVLSWRLGNFREENPKDIAKRNKAIDHWENHNSHIYDYNLRDSRINSSTSFNFTNKSRFSKQVHNPAAVPAYRRREGRAYNRQTYAGHLGSGEKKFLDGSTSSLVRESPTNSSSAAANNEISNESRAPSIIETNSRTDSLTSSSQGSYPNSPMIPEQRFNFDLMYTILLVTCYSEGEDGLRTTLESLAATDYPVSHKIIMCIADGIIHGAGNKLSTPEICLGFMTDFIVPEEKVRAHSYVAIADGKKRHNMAKVYAGYYKYKDRRIPMITLVKCGGPGEENDPKPGNRGKRDSQIILISFLQKVMFNERMTPLEYEFFNAIRTVSGVTPDCFELVLMVDADTKIFQDSLTRMVACMSRDSSIMGLCGETKIANKCDSWVTRIQAPKGPRGYWVPILANPDIVEHYSENIVNTLHKKNLLLLGEDRYLTTLMLRTFPKRKLLFVPQAVCKTIVPDTFKVLRSQRRRWINSTVHNLLELVLIPDLCGIFCFSMQFVIFMELVGTVVLPAAISFTMYLVIISIFERPIPYVPLALLAVVLGLPAVLILLTTRKLIYVGWMIIYLFSLPIWNFVLPVYAYWHFDDFSWGQTRVVEGEEAGADHSRKEGEFDSTKIVMKRWAEWEREKFMYYRNSIQRYIQSSSDEGYVPSSTRPSSSSTIYGSDKSQIYAAQPTTSHLNPRRKRTKSHTTDSLMLPPHLSGSNSAASDSTSNNSPLSPGVFNENMTKSVVLTIE